MNRDGFSKTVKFAAWKRCGGRCEECGEIVIGLPHEYDHRTPRAFKRDNSLRNIQVLCLACHLTKTQRDMAAIAKSNRIIKREALHRERLARKHSGAPD